jgi:enterochelin esterase family protein
MLRTASTILLVSLAAIPLAAADLYPLGPDSKKKSDVPTGTVTEHVFKDSKIYPGTTRKYWVYVPANLKTVPNLMVFQDGNSFQNPNGSYRVPIVFDNLIQAQAMPPTVAVLINPGEFPDQKDRAGKPRSNRSVEYDTVSDQYALFLEQELLVEVSKLVKFTDEPSGRAICGSSSGGICAFTVAWQKPDRFRKVVSFIGSFTNIRGGDVYPGLIRKAAAKPLRVFLQDGVGDLDNPFGHWPYANFQMAAALRFAGYDAKFVMGDGAHNGQHAGAILPDALRWIWRK